MAREDPVARLNAPKTLEEGPNGPGSAELFAEKPQEAGVHLANGRRFHVGEHAMVGQVSGR
jgi:hypothetical protein